MLETFRSLLWSSDEHNKPQIITRWNRITCDLVLNIINIKRSKWTELFKSVNRLQVKTVVRPASVWSQLEQTGNHPLHVHEKHTDRSPRLHGMLSPSTNASQNMSQLPWAGASPARRPTCACGLRGRWSPVSSVNAASADSDGSGRQTPLSWGGNLTHRTPLSFPWNDTFHPIPHCYSFIAAPRRAQTTVPSHWLPQQIETVGSQSERCNITCALFLNAEILLGDQSKCLKLAWWIQKQTQSTVDHVALVSSAF